MTSLACSTLERPTTGEIPRAQGPGTVFFTVEAAVLDAMAYAHTKRFPGGRPHLLAGTIHRVDVGYSYAAPKASDRFSALSPARAHFRLGPDDVASYLVYSKRNNRQIDRRNESLSRNARSIVDDKDPMHRPIFLLTPSLNVVAYDGNAAQSIARLDAPRSTLVAASER
jgi:hypothetical protein